MSKDIDNDNDELDFLDSLDTERITRNLEAAYTTMWERYQRGEDPATFAVSGTLPP